MDVLKYVNDKFIDKERIRKHNERVDEDIQEFARQELKKIHEINRKLDISHKNNNKRLTIIIISTIINLIVQNIPEMDIRIKFTVGTIYIILTVYNVIKGMSI